VSWACVGCLGASEGMVLFCRRVGSEFGVLGRFVLLTDVRVLWITQDGPGYCSGGLDARVFICTSSHGAFLFLGCGRTSSSVQDRKFSVLYLKAVWWVYG